MRPRDDAQLAARLADWAHQQSPERGAATVTDLRRPSAGWSNETVLCTLNWEQGDPQRIVLRLPTLVPSFPVYDLGAQARVLQRLATAGVPAPRLVAYEAGTSWLGAPFLVMSHVPGRPGPEAPGLDPWLAEAPGDAQRAVQERFLDTLASIHHVDASGCELRGGTGALADEVAWWATYVDWATDGAPPRLLADAIAWCGGTVPRHEPDAALCWGDARLGNVMFDDDRRVVAVLDWELASIGPPEMDLAWYLALEALTAKYTAPVPGFFDRAGAIAFYEQRLGRTVVDLEWHEVFALVRSAAINDRQARMAHAAGVQYPGVAGDENPVLRYVARQIEQYGSTG
jgi:aminoglycoside phosphotransferase (APT) family kinase protein